MEGNQAIASRPDAQVWLSASAGAGKTQVLTARVLRLLLNGADPESILCLTFTKAGAAEMADRVHERLGAWVTLPLTDLRKDLFNLCERHLDDDQIASARQLFAKVLDARGGGLRIQTIHSFAQTLLAAFPTEASLPVGFRPIEGREEGQLQNEALADLVAQAEQEGRAGVLNRMQFLARTLGEEATRNLLQRCAQVPDVMEDLGPGADARVRRWLGLGDFDVQAKARADCADDGFDLDALQAIQNMFVSAPGVRLQGFGQRITDWRARDVAERMASLGDLLKAWSYDDGRLRENSGWIPKNADYLDLVRPLHAHFLQLRELLHLDDTARRLSAALLLGQDYARAYADAKRAAGAVDFNDMIRATVRLLQQPGIGDWIRYKLDQSVDHILVDEAQDTNAAQWDIVKALTEEFFAGAGAKADRMRTVFAVGDFKQAIFGFQGTDPEQFEKAGRHFRGKVEAAELDFQPLTISQSFRSSQPILDVVDAVIADLGHETMGLSDKPQPHESAKKGSGHVELFPFIQSDADAEGDIDTDADGDAEEDWFSASELNWASALAKKVRHWTRPSPVM
jgi:ATP-dependent helicase/nuclease subunit A